MRWYITVAAVHEFQRICGLPRATEGPDFDDPAKQLTAACDAARIKKTEPHREIYEAKVTVHGKRVRLELYVSTTPRPEGPLPQLVRVRRK